jgi:hypothetical protein
MGISVARVAAEISAAILYQLEILTAGKNCIKFAHKGHKVVIIFLKDSFQTYFYFHFLALNNLFYSEMGNETVMNFFLKRRSSCVELDGKVCFGGGNTVGERGLEALQEVSFILRGLRCGVMCVCARWSDR